MLDNPVITSGNTEAIATYSEAEGDTYSGPASATNETNSEVTDPGAGTSSDAEQAEKTAAEANAKAEEQSKRCSGGACGSEVPGQCCEWMSKFNIATQRAMRPYSNSCGSCNGSGEKGGGPCQACDGTGIEGSTGGGFNQSVILVRLEYITRLEQLDAYAKKWGYITIERMEELVGIDFEHRWKYNYTPYITKSYKSVSLDTLNSYYKTQGYIVTMIQTLTNRQEPLILQEQISVEEAGRITTIESYPLAYKKSNLVPIYYYDEVFYALQSDIKEEFPGEDF